MGSVTSKTKSAPRMDSTTGHDVPGGASMNDGAAVSGWNGGQGPLLQLTDRRARHGRTDIQCALHEIDGPGIAALQDAFDILLFVDGAGWAIQGAASTAVAHLGEDQNLLAAPRQWH